MLLPIELQFGTSILCLGKNDTLLKAAKFDLLLR